MFNSASFAENLALRKESARRTLRRASSEELLALVAELFAEDTAHPFYEPLSQFIEEHRSETAVRGETADGIAFVYYPRTNRGMWYTHTGKQLSVGRIGTNGLQALSEISAEAGFS